MLNEMSLLLHTLAIYRYLLVQKFCTTILFNVVFCWYKMEKLI